MTERGAWIDPGRLLVIVNDAIGQQPSWTQERLLDAVRRGDTDVLAPPGGPWVHVLVDGALIAKVHRRRLMRQGASN